MISLLNRIKNLRCQARQTVASDQTGGDVVSADERAVTGSKFSSQSELGKFDQSADCQDKGNSSFPVNHMVEEDLHSLGPSSYEDVEAYVDSLSWAFSQSTVNNIAVVGPNGSGKTSLLKSYEAWTYTAHRKPANFDGFLYITLGTLSHCTAAVSRNSEAAPSVSKGGRPSQEWLAELQHKIIEQLLCNARPKVGWSSALPQFDHSIRSSKTSCGRYFLSLIFVLSFVYCLGFNGKPGLPSLLLKANLPRWDLFIEMCAALVCTACFVYFLYLARCRGYKLRSLRFSELAVEGDPRLPFDTYLDDIAYVLENSGKHFIVFDDLDRLEDGNPLLGSLRELNIKLNAIQKTTRESSESEDGQRFTFIYCVTPSQLNGLYFDEDGRTPAWVKRSEMETKFFDFVLNIVPAADAFNAEDILIQRLGKNTIDRKLLDLCGPYLINRRACDHVCNDFLIKKDVFCGERIFDPTINPGNVLDDNKLFALTMLEYLNPQAYEQLRHNIGPIYDLVLGQPRLIYSDPYDHSTEDLGFDSDIKYQILNQMPIASVRMAPFNSTLGVSFDAAKEKLESSFSEELDNSVWPSPCDFIARCIVDGYISEDYQVYMSAWTEGRLTLNDRVFLNLLISTHNHVEYWDPERKIDDPNEVLSSIKPYVFENNAVGFNYRLVDHLCKYLWDNRECYSAASDSQRNAPLFDAYNLICQHIIRTALDHKKYQLIAELCIRSSPQAVSLIRKCLSSSNVQYPVLCTQVDKENVGTTGEEKAALFITNIIKSAAFANNKDPWPEKDSLQRSIEKFASKLPDISRNHGSADAETKYFIEGFNKIPFGFITLERLTSNVGLIQLLDKRGDDCFKLTCDNARTVFQYVYGERERYKLRGCLLTCVAKHADSGIAKRLGSNPKIREQFLKSMFEGQLLFSDSLSIARTYLEDKQINIDVRREYLLRLVTPVSSVWDIGSVDLWPDLIERVPITTSNIVAYFSQCIFDKQLDEHLELIFDAGAKNGQLKRGCFAPRFFKTVGAGILHDLQFAVVTDKKLKYHKACILMFTEKMSLEEVVPLTRLRSEESPSYLFLTDESSLETLINNDLLKLNPGSLARIRRCAREYKSLELIADFANAHPRYYVNDMHENGMPVQKEVSCVCSHFSLLAAAVIFPELFNSAQRGHQRLALVDYLLSSRLTQGEKVKAIVSALNPSDYPNLLPILKREHEIHPVNTDFHKDEADLADLLIKRGVLRGGQGTLIVPSDSK